jgi:hypothetical protein
MLARLGRGSYHVVRAGRSRAGTRDGVMGLATRPRPRAIEGGERRGRRRGRGGGRVGGLGSPRLAAGASRRLRAALRSARARSRGSRPQGGRHEGTHRAGDAGRRRRRALDRGGVRGAPPPRPVAAPGGRLHPGPPRLDPFRRDAAHRGVRAGPAELPHLRVEGREREHGPHARRRLALAVRRRKRQQRDERGGLARPSRSFHARRSRFDLSAGVAPVAAIRSRRAGDAVASRGRRPERAHRPGRGVPGACGRAIRPRTLVLAARRRPGWEGVLVVTGLRWFRIGRIFEEYHDGGLRTSSARASPRRRQRRAVSYRLPGETGRGGRDHGVPLRDRSSRTRIRALDQARTRPLAAGEADAMARPPRVS